MMIVCGCDGYILGVHGPYFADGRNNDEAIFKAITGVHNEGFAQFFKIGDLIIWNREFRYVIELAKRLGFEVKMPHFMKKNQKQHSSQEANESRAVKMIRRVIESVNGRIKNVFKYFAGTIRNLTIPGFVKLFKIGCALINAFMPPMRQNEDYDEYLAQLVINRTNRSNIFQAFVEAQKLVTRRIIWESISQDELTDFPKLSLSDLQDITLGTYQRKLAPSYTAQHHSGDGKYELSYYKVEEYKNILHVKLQSRHKGYIEYKIFIRFCNCL